MLQAGTNNNVTEKTFNEVFASSYVATPSGADDYDKEEGDLWIIWINLLADFNKPQLEQVIHRRGKPLKPTNDPLEMEISAGNQLVNKIRTRGIDPKDLT